MASLIPSSAHALRTARVIDHPRGTIMEMGNGRLAAVDRAGHCRSLFGELASAFRALP